MELYKKHTYSRRKKERINPDKPQSQANILIWCATEEVGKQKNVRARKKLKFKEDK